MLEDVNQVSQLAGIAIPPGKHPLLAILSKRGPQTVGELARATGSRQPVTTRNIGKLIALDLVELNRSSADGRSRIVSLTPAGKRAIDRSRETVWPLVESAVRQVAEGLSGPLLSQLDGIEQALAERSLAKRAAAIAAAGLLPANDADVPSIVALMNRAYRGSAAASGWTTETEYIKGDRMTESLLRADMSAKPAGSLLTWRDAPGGLLKGCVWLEPLGSDVWYLGLLAIEPQRQNGGHGRTLLACAEQWVRERVGRRIRITVVNVRRPLIAWYHRRGYQETGETSPFPYGDDRYGTPQREDLSFVVMAKELGTREA